MEMEIEEQGETGKNVVCQLKDPEAWNVNKVSVEKVLPIVYQPKAVFRICPINRCSSTIAGMRFRFNPVMIFNISKFFICSSPEIATHTKPP